MELKRPAAVSEASHGAPEAIQLARADTGLLREALTAEAARRSPVRTHWYGTSATDFSGGLSCLVESWP